MVKSLWCKRTIVLMRLIQQILRDGPTNSKILVSFALEYTYSNPLSLLWWNYNLKQCPQLLLMECDDLIFGHIITIYKNRFNILETVFHHNYSISTPYIYDSNKSTQVLGENGSRTNKEKIPNWSNHETTRLKTLNYEIYDFTLIPQICHHKVYAGYRLQEPCLHSIIKSKAFVESILYLVSKKVRRV